ncbi:MAG: hypothetical protein CVV03_11500 [Firmicutes bacterium HGW-Firmicutes-8]|nr:MAG: hypothetical protein CVV03_11500 [Firmicutes bacterium HGW-Firmicutes-8]
MLEIENNCGESASCLKLIGELDISTVEKFRASIEKVPETIAEVDLDFSGLEFVDSTGIGSLVQVMNQMKAQDKKVMVKGISKEIYEVFVRLGIPELMGQGHFECSGN